MADKKRYVPPKVRRRDRLVRVSEGGGGRVSDGAVEVVPGP